MNFRLTKKGVSWVILFILSIIPFLISNYFLFLKDPPVWPDEPVFLDSAKNLVSTGNLYTNLVGSLTASNEEKAGMGFPPLYFYVLGTWTRVFGNSIESVRLLSLLIGFAALITFFLIAKRLLSTKLALVGTFILSLDPHFSRSSRLGRMEILTFFFISLSLLLLLKVKSRKNVFLYILPGTAATFATLAHTAGFISLAILVLGILTQDEKFRKKIIQIVVAALPVFLLNVIWIINKKDALTPFIGVFSLQFQDKISKTPYIFVLFQSDFSWWLLFITYLSVATISGLLLIKNFSKEKLFILSGLIVSTVLVIFGKEGGYIIYLQPFVTLNILSIVSQSKQMPQSLVKTTVFGLTTLIAINYVNIQFINNDNIGITRPGLKSIFDTNEYKYHQFTEQILDKLPKDKNITVFISSAPDPYFDLATNKNIKFYEMIVPSAKIINSKYKDLLDSTDYIIFTWIPHQYLADYINNNKEEFIHVGTEDSYQATIVKLKPLKDRI